MGKLYLVGVSTGNYEDLTIKAYNTLINSDLIYCDEKMFLILSKYIDKNKLISNNYTSTRERCINAINSANDKIVSIVGSGDVGIYGITSVTIRLIEELNKDLNYEIIPGITSFLKANSLLGSPITNDFALISLSDNFDTKDNIKRKIDAISKTNMIIIFYSPNYDNLLMAKEILLRNRNENDLVGIVSDMGYNNQSIIVTNLSNLDKCSSLSTIIVGNNETIVSKTLNKNIITPLY